MGPAILQKAGAALVKKTLFLDCIVYLLILLFIYTGLNKLMDYTNFRNQLGRSPFLQHISGLVALALPPGELLIALGLIFNRTRLLALYVSVYLMALFTGYIYMMLHFSYDLPCSCGGILAKMDWHDHLLFNSIVTILAIIAVFLQSSPLFIKPNHSTT